MKKITTKIFAFGVFAILGISAQAEQISQSEASSIATQFLTKLNGNSIATQSNKKLTFPERSAITPL